MSFSIQYIFDLVDKFTPGAAAISAAATNMRGAIAGAGAAMASFAARATMFAGVVGAGMTLMLLNSAQAAAKFEDKMAEVRKVIPDMTKDQMWKLGDDVLALSAKTALTADAVADIYASGARMGIRGEKPMAKFAETVVKVAAAWDGVSAAFASESLATISGKFFNSLGGEEAQERMVGVADAINYLSQNTPGVKNAEMLKFFQNAGPMFAQMRLTAEEAAAYGAAAMMTGKSSGLEEGTRAQMSLQRLMLAATKATGTKKGKTGLGDALSSIGYSQKQWGDMMLGGPQDAILDLFGRLETLDPLKKQKFLKDFLGDARAAKQMTAMTGQFNEYKRALAQVSDKYAERFSGEKDFMDWMKKAYPAQADLLERNRKALHYGSVDQEYAARMDTMVKQSERFGRALDWLNINIGRPMLPMLSSLYGGLADAASGMASFAQSNQDTIKYFGTGGMMAAIGALGAGLLQVAAWATGASGALAVLAGLGVVMLKVSMVALGIGALYMIYDKWPQLMAWAADPLNFQIHFPEAPDWLKQFLDYQTMSKTQNEAAKAYRDMSAGKGLPGDLAAAKNGPGPWNLWGLIGGGAASPSEEWYAQMAGRISAFNLPPLPAAAGAVGGVPLPSPNPDRIPQAAAERVQIESTIRGEIAPLQVTATPITVHVTGQVNGPVTGTGSGSLSTNAPRGVSTSEAGSTSVSP